MKYHRIENCYVRGNSCIHMNEGLNYVEVCRAPFEAKDGDIFCAADIMANGYTDGVMWVPENQMFRFDYPTVVATFDNFEAAQKDGLKTMAVVVARVEPETLREKIFNGHEWEKHPLTGPAWEKFLGILENRHLLSQLAEIMQRIFRNSAPELTIEEKREIIDIAVYQKNPKKDIRPKM